MQKNKTVYIVTANDYLIYQPTILNVYDELIKHVDVRIVSFEPNFISKQKDEVRKADYLRIPKYQRFLVQNFDYAIQLGFKFLRRFKVNVEHKHSFYSKLQSYHLDNFVSTLKPGLIIAVDIAALYICQKYFDSTEFLSLEIYDNDPLQHKIDLKKIGSVFIQNEPRFKYLFQDAPLKTFYVQNAPSFREELSQNDDRDGLVWAGSIVRRFAVIDTIEFLRSYPRFSLTLKGGGEKKTIDYIRNHYRDLIDQEVLTIDQSYQSNDEFIQYLSRFRIGFCFYSWELIRSSINYQTAPSGKLFMCLAAGVPIIASDIPGFQFVKEAGAGVLVQDYKPATIKAAIDKIESAFGSYHHASLATAKLHSFDVNVKPYISYIIGKLNKT